MASAELTGLLLAAGLGSRFGGGKLSAELDGAPLALHAARELAGQSKHLVAVCNPANTALNGALAALGYQTVENAKPARGLSSSLALGAAAARGDGLLVCLADMPLITSAHLAALRQAFDASDRQAIVATSCGETRSPPAIFPRAQWEALKTMTGDKGARELLQTGLAVEAEQAMLIDIDTQADLAEIRAKIDIR
jgi:molybdenum cofactor cytidylyltransferase